MPKNGIKSKLDMTPMDYLQNAVRRLGRSAFRGLGELEVISLHDNRIDFIEDDAFADLRGLKSLDLSLNIIRSVGDNLDSLPGIMKLNLSDNYITSLGRTTFNRKYFSLKN